MTTDDEGVGRATTAAMLSEHRDPADLTTFGQRLADTGLLGDDTDWESLYLDA